MAHMPDIKPEVNKVDDGNKKKASGLLGSLFGGGGAGSGAAGGLGGAAAAGGGGLLATKAGLIGLIVIGSAVAGGIGLVGYSAFGPSAGDKGGGNLSLFAPKPKEADPNAVAPVAKDGSSASLNYFAQAAKQNKGGDAASGEGAPSDQTAGDAAASGDASAAATTAGNAAGNNPINSGGGAGATGSMGPGLQGAKKLGELSKASGGASSSASASTKGPGSLLDGINSSRGSVGGGFAKGNAGGTASLSARRGVASRKGGKSGMRQLASVLRDKGSGATYDGGRGVGTSAGAMGEIGPDGGAIGMDGAGAGSGGAQPTSTPNSAPNLSEYEPPEPKPKEMITPWAKAVAQAQMLVMVAMGLAFAASKIPKSPWTQAALIAIGVAICLVGAYIGYLAGKIMSGEHGQKLQGGVVAAAALGVIITGIAVATAAGKEEGGTGDYEGKKVNPNGLAGDGLLGNGLILLGGGLAAVSAIGLMFTPKPKPIEVEKGKGKDYDIGYVEPAPSQDYSIKRIA